MSWTENKNNKQNFFRQMGNRYLNDECIGKTVGEILANNMGISKTKSGYLQPLCCSKEPLVRCSYRDKPSIKPCRASPTLDQGKPSFW